MENERTDYIAAEIKRADRIAAETQPSFDVKQVKFTYDTETKLIELQHFFARTKEELAYFQNRMASFEKRIQEIIGKLDSSFFVEIHPIPPEAIEQCFGHTIKND